MPTYQRCNASVQQMGLELMQEFEDHKDLIEAKVKIDYIFAYPEYDQRTEEPIGVALKKNGVRCLGLTRKMSLKDRVMGRGDAEILLDGDWWTMADDKERRALLDHELHHIAIKGKHNKDDIGRPLLWLRPHDVECGWFKCIADRHGPNSIERRQAKWIYDSAGKSFFPDIVKLIGGGSEL